MDKEVLLLSWIQEWFVTNCDGDWEHDKNLVIETIDNPGWSVFINLTGTYLENKSFKLIEINRSESDWIYCAVKKNKFESAGGSKNLIEILQIFQVWAEENH